MPTGDMDADFDIIRKFYTGKQGLIPTKQGEVILAK
jgi:hypothetical protein